MIVQKPIKRYFMLTLALMLALMLAFFVTQSGLTFEDLQEMVVIKVFIPFWETVATSLGFENDTGPTVFIMQSLLFVIVELYVSIIAMLSIIKYSKPTMQQSAGNILRTSAFHFNYLIGIMYVLLSGGGLYALFSSDGSALLLGTAPVKALFFIAAPVICGAVTVWSVQQLKRNIEHLLLLQMILIICTDVPIYIAGLLGGSMWSNTVLIINCWTTVVTPYMYYLNQPLWIELCDGWLIPRLKWLLEYQQPTHEKETLYNKKILCLVLFRFIAISKLIAWLIANLNSSAACLLPEVIKVDAIVTVSIALMGAWVYTARQLLSVTLAISSDKSNKINLVLPFEMALVYQILLKEFVVTGYISYCRHFNYVYQKLFKKLEFKQRKHHTLSDKIYYPLRKQLLKSLIRPIALLGFVIRPLYGADMVWLNKLYLAKETYLWVINASINNVITPEVSKMSVRLVTAVTTLAGLGAGTTIYFGHEIFTYYKIGINFDDATTTLCKSKDVQAIKGIKEPLDDLDKQNALIKHTPLMDIRNRSQHYKVGLEKMAVVRRVMRDAGFDTSSLNSNNPLLNT